MSFMDFDLPIPLEMQADSLDMWGWPMKTVKIEVREAIQLGYKFMPRRAPMISGLNETGPTPPSSLPPHPLMTVSSTFQTDPSPLEHYNGGLPILDLSYNPLPPVQEDVELEGEVPDIWVNSQTSVAEQASSTTPDFIPLVHPKATVFTPPAPKPFCLARLDKGLVEPEEQSPPALEPDSADTSFSTLGPQTPSSSQSYTMGDLDGAACEIPRPTPPSNSPSPTPVLADPFLPSTSTPAVASPAPHVEAEDQTSTLAVDVEAQSPPLAKRMSPKPAYIDYNPSRSVRRTKSGTHDASPARARTFLTQRMGTPFPDRDAHQSSSPSPAIRANIPRRRGAPKSSLDIFAEIASSRQPSATSGMPSENEESDSEDVENVLRVAEEKEPDDEVVMGVDDKRGIMEQRALSPRSPFLEQLSVIMNRSDVRPPATPVPISKRSLRSSGPLAPIDTIPPSEIPGSEHISPAKTATSDDTTGSETTPAEDSRQKRYDERQAKRSRDAEEVELEAKHTECDEEGFTPGSGGLRKAASAKLKQRLMDGTSTFDRLSSVTSSIRGRLPSVARPLPADTISSLSIVLDEGMSVGGSSATSTRLESIPSGSLVCIMQDTPAPPGKGKTKPSNAPPPRPLKLLKSTSSFIAPKPIKKATNEQPPLPSKPDYSDRSMRSNKRKQGADAAHPIDVEAEVAPKQKKPKPMIKTPLVIRTPIEALSQPIDQYTSIGEAAKLRRASKEATTSRSSTGGSSSGVASAPALVSNSTRSHSSKVNPNLTAPKKVASKTRPTVPASPITLPPVPTDYDDELDAEGEPDDELAGPIQEDEAEEVQEQESEGKEKAGRGYTAAEKQILLASWDGFSALNKSVQEAAARALVDAGFAKRSPKALRWYMANTMKEDFKKKHQASLARKAKSGRTRN